MASSKLTGRLKDMAFSRSNKQIISIEVNEDFREEFDTLAGYDLDIEIKKHSKKRSLEASAYCWVLCDKLAEKMDLPKEEVYRNAIRHIGGVSEIVCVQEKAYQSLKQIWEDRGIGWQTDILPSKIEGCVNMVLYYGSSTYDSKQMSSLISQLVRDCESVGISTMTPSEIDAMIARWGQKKEKENGSTITERKIADVLKD